MKFIINRESCYNSHKDRVIILKREEDVSLNMGVPCLRNVRYMANVVIKKADWNEEDPFPIVSDTDSIQLRPRGIFRTPKGFYYKEGTRRNFLTYEQETELDKFIKAAVIHLTESANK